VSTFSMIGGGIVGGVTAIAAIVTVETRPTPPSAIVLCESYSPTPGPTSLVAVDGCRIDGRSVRVVVVASPDNQPPP
jgi:hypothetical protein